MADNIVLAQLPDTASTVAPTPRVTQVWRTATGSWQAARWGT